MELEGKIAVVTGGANGVGKGIVQTLAQRGANIVVADLDEQAAKQTAAEVERMGRECVAVRADVGEMREVDGIITSALTVFGRVDFLVNNAGVIGGSDFGTRGAANGNDWDLAFAINMRGIVHTIESAQDHMKERRQGRIINVVSMAARRGTGGVLAHYAASKAAALNVSQAYALRLAPFNINVNAICPGPIWTPLAEAWFQARKVGLDPSDTRTPKELFDEHVRETTALGRAATPEDVGRVTAFLCSDRARNIAGQAINVNAGAYFN